MAVGGEDAVGSENYACRSTWARRDRHVGEMGTGDSVMWSSEAAASQKFWARIGFAWRHYSNDAPAASACCLGPMGALLERRAVGQGRRAHKALRIRVPPGLEGELLEHDVKQTEEVAPRAAEATAAIESIAAPRIVETSAYVDTIAAVQSGDNMTATQDGAEAEVAATGAGRKLKAHVSDVSTCADSAASETTFVGKHPHRPRVGRRAKARARRDEWENAKRQSWLESMNDSAGTDRSLVGAFLACIDEDAFINDDGAEDGFSCSSKEGCEETSSDGAGSKSRLWSRSQRSMPRREEMSMDDKSKEDKSMDDKSMDDTSKAEKEDKSMDDKSMDDPSMDDKNRDDKSMASEESGANECSDMEDREIEELATWSGQESWEDMEEGAKLLPAKLILALLHLQKAALNWQEQLNLEDPQDWTSSEWKAKIYEGARDLLPKLKRTRSVAMHLEATWNCPAHLGSVWSNLREWVEEDEGGPGYQQQQMEELLEELEDSRYCGESAIENLQCEAAIRSSSLLENWNGLLEILDSFDLAQRRKLSLDQKVASELNARLEMSLAGRTLPR